MGAKVTVTVTVTVTLALAPALASIPAQVPSSKLATSTEIAIEIAISGDDNETRLPRFTKCMSMSPQIQIKVTVQYTRARASELHFEMQLLS
jgi:hypothetical protein